jgi:cytochrome c oxidase subunit 3
MSLIKSLMAKPWTAEQTLIDNRYPGDASESLVKRLALRVFLGVVAVLFILLIVAYAGRMGYSDWRPVPQLSLLWVNTGALLLASLAFELSRYALNHNRLQTMRVSLLAGGALTLVFLFGQMLAWRQLTTMSYFDITIPAIGFFYILTGLHALHMVGGLFVWGNTVPKVWNNFDRAKVKQTVDLCATYWNFLLLVWVVMFGLLFSGDNLDALLKLCGIK